MWGLHPARLSSSLRTLFARGYSGPGTDSAATCSSSSAEAAASPHLPWGAHPSYVQGAYDRDNRFYIDWDPISRDEGAVQAWLRNWVYGLDGRAAYVEKLGAERVASLRPSGPAPSASVDYGQYR